LQAGLLKENIGSLPNSTSKLVLVNVGGAIQIAATASMPSSGVGNDKLQQTVAQLVKACEKTTVQLRTDEEINRFSMRTQISGMPPANQLLGPVMQMSQLMKEGRKQAWTERKKVTAPANIVKTGRAPVIDGQAEDLWSAAGKYDIKNVMYSPVSGPNDCSATYKAMWDSDNLYLLVEVTDDSLKNNGGDYWNNDGIEVFIDSDNSKSTAYGDNDFQFHFDWDKAKPIMAEAKHGDIQGVEFVMVTTGNGYRTEIKFPWSALKAKPSAGVAIGLDIQVNDDDDGGDRDSKLAWHCTEDNAWNDPSTFGNAQLLGLVGWWKFDEKDGTTAADSSGNGNNGTLQGGPKWQPSGGKIGGALDFDGVDDYVETNYATDLPTWTVAVWVNSPAEPSSVKPTGPVHREKNYQINWDHVVDNFRGSAGVCIGGEWYDASFGPLQANTWYHLVATYDGKSLKAYKDGALISKNQDPSGPPDSEAATLKFGKHATGSYYFGGKIDDVRIYNYALSDADIAALCAGR
jgi:hypothetical protein